MTTNFGRALGIAAFCMVSAGAASAATFDLGAGGAICEGPASLLPDECFDPDLVQFNDGPTGANGPTINLTFDGSESAIIYGGVRGRDDDEFADRFVLNGSGDYKLTLTLLNIKTDNSFTGPDSDDPQFDATWTMGDSIEVGDIGNQTGNADMLMGIFDLSGGLQFELNAAGSAADGSYAEYRLDIEAVPLPAAAWMLIAGVGGLGALSRRKKKAAKA